MTREFPSHPIVGVGAVVVDGESVLLIRRGQEPLKGEWSLPGGAVELGETLDAAIVREVREEAGLDIAVGPVVEVLDRLRLAPDGRVRFHYVLIDFLCRPAASASGQASAPVPASASTSSTAPIVSGSDADAAEWVDLRDLAAYRVAEPTARVIRKALDRARAGQWVPLGGYQKGE
jgi:mutator protein MutT